MSYRLPIFLHSEIRPLELGLLQWGILSWAHPGMGGRRKAVTNSFHASQSMEIYSGSTKLCWLSEPTSAMNLLAWPTPRSDLLALDVRRVMKVTDS